MYCTKEGCIAQATEITTYSTFIAELKAERAPEGRWSRLRRPLPGSAGKVPGLVNAGFFFLAVGSVTPTVPRPRTGSPSGGAHERVLFAGAERGLPGAAPRGAVGAAPHLLDEGADLRCLGAELLQLLLPGLHLGQLAIRLVLHRFKLLAPLGVVAAQRALQRGLHLAEGVGMPALGRRPLLLQHALRLEPRGLLALKLLLRLLQGAQLLLHPRQLALHAR